MSTSKTKRQASFSGKLDIQKPMNADVRPREYLTDKEVERLMKAAANTGRHGHRDSTLILVTYRHANPTIKNAYQACKLLSSLRR